MSNNTKPKPNVNLNVNGKPFDFVTSGLKHSIGIQNDVAFSWGTSNSLGQLGRSTSSKAEVRKPTPVTYRHDSLSSDDSSQQQSPPMIVRAFVGGYKDSGHSALLDSNGMLWMSGCDRWQQLGLGSAKGGSSGYTWTDGKLWQEVFRPTVHLLDLMRENNRTASTIIAPSSSQTTNNKYSDHLIRDISLGGDHTLVLSTNRRDVYAFGKGGDGQIGLQTKAFVSAPVKSVVLSSAPNNNGSSSSSNSNSADHSKRSIAAVCAIEACSMTLNESGEVLAKAGKCRSSNPNIVSGLQKCLRRSEQAGLLRL